jgi:hypothetical protein
MWLPTDKWRFARRGVLLAVAGALGGLVVVGLGQGRGAPYSLKPSASLADGSSATIPADMRSYQASVGRPKFAAKPPKVQLESRMLPASVGVPSVALDAYEAAAAQLATSNPTCQLSWEDLAGIGRVESDNGQTWGSAARVTQQGTVFPPIYGPVLDGADGFPAMPTTDAGRLEGGGAWTRAVGPMQFLPSTWLAYAQSDIGDNPPNPQNFYDAALTTGRYLCTNGGNLSKASGLQAAVYAYNHSDSYVALVEAWIAFYTREGPQALVTAGAGLLPVGTPGPGGGTSGGNGANAGAASLASAAAATDAKGSFRLAIDVLAGQKVVARGSAGVDVAARRAATTLRIDGLGSLSVRMVGSTAYVALPPKLHRSVGAEGPWVALSKTVIGRLPVTLGAGLLALTDDLPYVVAQLGAGTGVMQLEGKGSVAGVTATEYLGTVDLRQAANQLPADRTQLVDTAALLGGYQIGLDAWVDGSGLVRSMTLALPKLPGSPANTPFVVELLLSGFGRPVQVAVPPVSGVSSSTPTSGSTTSTTAGSTSSSSSSTSSTSTTPTTSSTTTTTIPFVTTSAPTTSTTTTTLPGTTTASSVAGTTGTPPPQSSTSGPP